MAKRELLVATKNHGKVVEIEELLADTGLAVTSLSNFPDIADVEETGQTFADNALLKANYYYSKTGMLALSDDSGLQVDALGGAPGVYSARYAGPNSTDQDRYKKLLAALADVPPPARTARFICVIALVGADCQQLFRGSVEGRIIFAPRGEHGFGYDPIFEYPPLSKTFAELSSKEKAAISHRGKALAQARDFLTRAFPANSA
jgi:XTP/dITP diphosphohydrolase